MFRGSVLGVLVVVLLEGCVVASAPGEPPAPDSATDARPTAAPQRSADTRPQATLRWTAPVRRVNGECLSDLAGFVVSWGVLRARLDREQRLSVVEAACRETGRQTACGPERACSYTIGGLGPVKWYFRVRAVDGEGRVSPPSETVFIDLD